MEEWMGYVCPGGEKVDMHPESVFECSDEAGVYLLRTLGASGWLVLADESAPVEEVKVVDDVVVETVAEELKEEVMAEAVAEEPKEEVVAEKPKEEAPAEVVAEKPKEEVVAEEPKVKKFCEYCDSKGGPSKKHKLLCRRPRE